MAWVSAHHDFVIETLFKTGKSAIGTQRVFRIDFRLRGNDAVQE